MTDPDWNRHSLAEDYQREKHYGWCQVSRCHTVLTEDEAATSHALSIRLGVYDLRMCAEHLTSQADIKKWEGQNA